MMDIQETSNKSWTKTLLFAIFLGNLGVHRFFVGKRISGIVYLLTVGCFGFGWIIDIILIATGKFTDGNGALISSTHRKEDLENTHIATTKSMSNKYIPKSRIVAIICIVMALIGFMIYVTKSADPNECLPPTIAFFITAIVCGIISLGAPKTNAEAAERKAIKQRQKDAQREQLEYEHRMRAYKGVFLSEQQIQRLENKIELPIVDTPLFLSSGEVAVYYSVATRQETKHRVVGRTGGYSGGTVRIAKGFSIHTGSSSSRPVYGDVSTHYDGELVLTNKRLVFLSNQKGFEVPYTAITAATSYSDGLSIQSRSHTYTLLLPKADLAVLAFDSVRTGEIPIVSNRGDSYDNAFEDSRVDCRKPKYVEDELFEDAVDAIMETGQASVSILQRKLKVGYSRAARLIDKMEEHGIIGPFEGSRPRQILISDSEWEEMRDWIAFGEEDCSDIDAEETKQTPNVSEIDGMDGHEFEYFCADLLRKNGFVNVKVTPGSGDQGVDILAEKGGVKYAIQCKNYSSPLSNTPVQDVKAGKVFYGCHVGVVMTNSTFTPGANALAQATGVLLWDRAVLQSMMENVD